MSVHDDIWKKMTKGYGEKTDTLSFLVVACSNIKIKLTE